METQGIAIDTCGTTLIVVHGRSDPTDSEWQQLLEAWRSHPEVTEQLVLTLGGGPNVVQRRQSLEILNARPLGSPPTAVLTDSVVVRGMVTALGWFATNRLRAFALERVEDALTFLHVDEAEKRRQLRERLAMLRRSVSD